MEVEGINRLQLAAANKVLSGTNPDTSDVDLLILKAWTDKPLEMIDNLREFFFQITCFHYLILQSYAFPRSSILIYARWMLREGGTCD
jgi:hypothetical protein